MEDIAPALLDRIMTDFTTEYNTDMTLSSLKTIIDAGKATYKEADEYAARIGEILARAFHDNVSSDTLPDGRMYYNIANRVIGPSLKNNYDITSEITQKVQETLNKAAGIRIKAQVPGLNQDKIDGLVDLASGAEKYDDISNQFLNAIVNYTQSIVTDSVRVNADFHWRSGLSPKIVRKAESGACKWCRALAGTYDYDMVSDTGNDVWRRHENCRCNVEYDPGNGARQNAHTKQWRNARESDKIEKRKGFRNNDSLAHINLAKAMDIFQVNGNFGQGITPEAIMNHLMTSSIGKHSVNFLKANNIKPQLIYIPQRHTNRGDQQGNIIRIYMSNILSEKVAAQTIVHEVAHCELGIGNCQLAEAICMAREKMHITNKDYLTQQEWEYVAKLARDNYPEYEWKHGGIGNYDEYINVIG